MAYYAQTLCRELAKRGHETHVITYHDQIRGTEKDPSRVVVHRVGNPVQTHINVLTWALTLSTEFERAFADIHHDIGAVDLLDCHEWTSVPAATSLSEAFGVPYVMTVNSLEEHRSAQPDSPLSLAIRHFERLGTQSSSLVVVKSKAMKEDVQRLHGLPKRKVRYVERDEALGGKVSGIYARVGARGESG